MPCSVLNLAEEVVDFLQDGPRGECVFRFYYMVRNLWYGVFVCVVLCEVENCSILIVQNTRTILFINRLSMFYCEI